MEKTNLENKSNQEGTATHSGWNQFYNLFSKYRDECIKIGQIVLGTNQEISIQYLRQYSSALYSMAQQVFSFYDKELEKKITNEWLDIVDTIEERIFIINDVDYKNQLLAEGKEFVPRELKMKLILFYNKINRLAAEADLLVGKEKKDLNEPKKGLLGL